MKIDTERIDEAVLGLLYLTLHDGNRAWKGMDWDALNRLHRHGLIEDPVNKAKSIALTPRGLERAEKIFAAKFAGRAPTPRLVRYGKMTAAATSADGVTGVLCRNAADDGYVFRVQGEDGTFTDYALMHDDLTVTIAPDALAAFYTVGDEHLLDHSPEVLGLEAVGRPRK